MNCTSGQCQSNNPIYSDLTGQNTLSEVLSPNFMVPQTVLQQQPSQAPGAQLPAPGSPAFQQLLGPYGVTGNLAPITPVTQPQAVTLESIEYLNGALRTQIGRKITVNFLIGTNTFVDKTGTLLAVGANYIIINEIETDDIDFCDFYTIKFVKVYH